MSEQPTTDLSGLSAEEVSARAAGLPAHDVDALIAAEERGDQRMPVLKALYDRRAQLGDGPVSSPGDTADRAPDPAGAPERSDPDDAPRRSDADDAPVL